MKTLIAILVLAMMVPLPAYAKDMQKYLSDTQDLASQGKHKEALERYIWFHDHALEHEPAMYGVRLSFALGYWKDLGTVYPPALAALKKTRDDKTVLLEDGKGNRRLFTDVMALNRTLGDDSKTVELFRKLDQNQEELATECWDIAKESIIKAKAYDLAKKYIGNPVREFGKAKEMYDINTAICGGKNLGEHVKAFNENHFVEETILLIDVAIALDDTKTAKEIQEKALAIVDDYRLRDAIPAVACIAPVHSPSVAEDSPIGEWVPVSTSRGGLGGTRMYETNGVVSVGFGAVLNLKYKIDDGQLILSGENSPFQPQSFTIVGQSLTLTDPKTGKKQELTRVKGSEGDGIIGKWTGDHYTGAKQIMHFTTNMNCYFSVPMISLTGTFTINGDILTEEFPKKGKTEWKCTVADDILTLTKIGGTKVEKYNRKK